MIFTISWLCNFTVTYIASFGIFGLYLCSCLLSSSSFNYEMHSTEFQCSPTRFLFLQGRYANRPIVELEIAAKEQMKITELRMAKLFSEKAKAVSQTESTKPQGICFLVNVMCKA